VPDINAIARALREVGGTVAWVLPEAGPPSEWAPGVYGPAVAAMFAASGGTRSATRRYAPSSFGDVRPTAEVLALLA
jgi:hypothetical protein